MKSTPISTWIIIRGEKSWNSRDYAGNDYRHCINSMKHYSFVLFSDRSKC